MATVTQGTGKTPTGVLGTVWHGCDYTSTGTGHTA